MIGGASNRGWDCTRRGQRVPCGLDRRIDRVVVLFTEGVDANMHR